MDAYDLSESKFLQEGYWISGVGATTVATGTVPEGKIWTFRALSYNPDTTETKVVHWRLVVRSGANVGIGWQGSVALGASVLLPFLTDGLEFKLYPGEYILCVRDSATAGSIMVLHASYIESDQPLYEYVEPQEQKRLNQIRRSTLHQIGGGGGGGSRPAGIFRSTRGSRTREPGR